MTVAPVPVASIPRVGAGAMLGRRVRDWAPALFVLVAFIGLWEGVVKAAHVERFLLPAPTAIWTAFINNQGQLWHIGWVTFQEAIGGFAIGCTAGILVAVVVARWEKEFDERRAQVFGTPAEAELDLKAGDVAFVDAVAQGD